MQAIECMAQSKDETCAYLCRLRRGRDRMMTEDFGTKLLWGQLGVVDLGAVRLAKQSGSCVVIDRCPKIELMRP
jgi:hypothetical protein